MVGRSLPAKHERCVRNLTAMICIRLEGGLGNQLFQYATGRALAIRHSTELVLDTSALNTILPGITSRSYELGHFNLVARFAKPKECRLPSWLRHLPALSKLISPWRMYVENGLGFNPRFTSLPDNTFLVGYWQSYRYFSDVRDMLISDLTLVTPMSAASNDIAIQIESSPSVAIHVRRGDYVSLASAANLHGALPSVYYIDAVREVSQAVHGARFFVFSDDPDWCRSNLQLNNTAIYVAHNRGTDSWQDLMLMSRCRHHIIANSSFSWWGAWLADQRHRITANRFVVAPARWFSGQPYSDLSDRFPPHWIVR